MDNMEKIGTCLNAFDCELKSAGLSLDQRAAAVCGAIAGIVGDASLSKSADDNNSGFVNELMKYWNKAKSGVENYFKGGDAVSGWQGLGRAALQGGLPLGLMGAAYGLFRNPGPGGSRLMNMLGYGGLGAGAGTLVEPAMKQYLPDVYSRLTGLFGAAKPKNEETAPAESDKSKK